MTDQDKKKRYKKYTSPKGTFVFPKLRKPDEKYNVYTVGLILPKAEADKIIARHKEDFDDAIAAGKEQYKKLKKSVRDKKPFVENDYYSEIYDDQDNPTGEVQFNFKLKAEGKDKKGEVYQATPPAVFDAKGKALPKTIDPWGGTVGKVAYQISPYFVAAVGAGLSLRLCAVQVLDLVAKGERSASSFGFEEEEGYTADTQDFYGDDDDKAKDSQTNTEEDDEDDDEADF